MRRKKRRGGGRGEGRGEKEDMYLLLAETRINHIEDAINRQ
tara:strand:- start:1291 stop:1413 length:123 start_codon:yes stop_codon:yes gene_type:complete